MKTPRPKKNEHTKIPPRHLVYGSVKKAMSAWRLAAPGVKNKKRKRGGWF
jgi:hypothetical protein